MMWLMWQIPSRGISHINHISYNIIKFCINFIQSGWLRHHVPRLYDTSHTNNFHLILIVHTWLLLIPSQPHRHLQFPLTSNRVYLVFSWLPSRFLVVGFCKPCKCDFETHVAGMFPKTSRFLTVLSNTTFIRWLVLLNDM